MPRLHTAEDVMENAKKICDIVKGAFCGWVGGRRDCSGYQFSAVHSQMKIMNGIEWICIYILFE
jgi:hypothetical protein